jgi:hypothetical protein
MRTVATSILTLAAAITGRHAQTDQPASFAAPVRTYSLLRQRHSRFVGHRPGVEVRWQIDRHAWLQADYGVFFAGDFLKQASPGRNINYTEFWAGYKF